VYRAAFAYPETSVRAHLENVVRSALLSSYNSLGFQYSVKES
jgi:hypothetical protein